MDMSVLTEKQCSNCKVQFNRSKILINKIHLNPMVIDQSKYVILVKNFNC